MKFLSEKTGLTTISCDYVWARRTRRSFRLIVAVSIVLMATLWFSEGYLRYDQSETQYRMSLTLHPAQARPILRTVVRRETEAREVPPLLYVEALAQVEEPDKILEMYQQAYQISPRNASLAINYGTFLYYEDQYDEARERFREAGVNPPRNVLPRYLEAAALAATLEEDADLSDLLALLTRANLSGSPVLFPEPLWHSSLPERGTRYIQLRREIAARISGPLQECSDVVLRRARESIDRGELADWDNWLERVQYMGTRMLGLREGDSPPTLVQLRAGLRIQSRALTLRREWSEISGGAVDPVINNALIRTNETLEAVEAFEANREHLIQSHHAQLRLPMMLLLKTALLFFGLYGAALVMHQIGVGGKRVRALPHIRAGKIAYWCAFLLLTAFLACFLALPYLGMAGAGYIYLAAAWYAVIAAIAIGAFVYPVLQVQTPDRCAKRTSRPEEMAAEEDSAAPAITLRRYIGVYGCLFRRYMGMVSGGLIIMTCAWLVAHRIMYGAYPVESALLSTGLEEATEVFLMEIQEHLADLL